MPRTYVALDLETTGLDPEQDTIIEVGAVRFSGDKVIETFSSLANPERPLPAKIIHLTHITNEEVSNAPSAHEVVHNLTRFIGDDIIIGHSIGFDMSFLARHRMLMNNRVIDTFELSTILMPHMSRHSLQHLSNELSLHPDTAHRALADAESAMRLFIALQEAARALPETVLAQVAELSTHTGWRQGFFFQDMLREHNNRPSGASIGQQLFAKLGNSGLPLFDHIEENEQKRLKPRRPLSLLDLEQMQQQMQPGGQLSKALSSYEDRPQQVSMASAVGNTLNDGGCLVVEAGTGVGKSIAYLLPCIEFALENDERVVISTHTINLQEQLFSKDIPQVSEALGLSPQVAILKGRNNYLCLSRFRTWQRRHDLSVDQAIAIAKIIVWLPGTTTGDRSELFLNSPAEKQFWQQVCADDSWCLGEKCRERQRGNCFFQRAHAKAEAAHVLIVNHSLLVADVATENAVLPAYEHLVIDEAHQLENATTRALRLELTAFTLRQALRDISLTEAGLQGGPLAAVEHSLAKQKRLDDRAKKDIVTLRETIDSAMPMVEELGQVMNDCARALAPRNYNNSENSYIPQRRITSKERETPEWRRLVETWASVSRLTRRINTVLEEVLRAFQSVGVNGDEENPVLQTLSASQRTLSENTNAFDEAIASPIAENVYWLSLSEATNIATLCRAPISVAESLSDSLFDKKRAVILTSATLTCDGGYDYFAQQVGLVNYEAMSLGSPFNYKESALVCLATDIPEPRYPGHQRAVNQAILNVARASGGRLMALFTSNSQLRQTTKDLTKPLEQENILTYSQAESSSRSSLLEAFKTTDRAVLFGTRSFWEGVDVPGDALQCLVMVKLPFQVPDDPIVAARSEHFTDPFNEYLLPEAILAFRQGFGRLIRTKSDRGVFIILDSRLRGKAYGQRFLRALPNCSYCEGSAASLADKVLLWLNRGSSV